MRKFITGLYGRTSKDDPRRVTIEIQQRQLREWAARDPLVESVIDEYWDDGVTGKLPLGQRPEGRRLLEDVRSGRLQSVVVAYSDRFGRTLLDGLLVVKELESLGVKLVAVNDGWDARRDDSPLYFQFRMMMSEEEHRRITQRMRDGKRRAMDRDNAPPGGPLVFGYRMNEHGQFVPDTAEAPVVVRVFEMALAGTSNQKILDWVRQTTVLPGRKFQRRAAGSEPAVVRTNRGASWHLSKVHKILTNPVYLGVRRWGDREFPCTPLVDRDTFDRVQVACKDKARRFGVGKGDPSKGLLSGLLKCGECGRPFYHKATVSHRGNGNADRYQMYACDGMRRKNGCKAKMLRVDVLDGQVWDIIESYLADPEALVRKVVAADERLGGQVAELDASETRVLADLSALDEEVRAVWAEQQANRWPMAWVTPKLNELNGRREALVAGLEDVRRRRAAASVGREESSAVLTELARLRSDLAIGPTQASKYRAVRIVVAGGVVKTSGTGWHKQAHVTVLLKWSERLTQSASRQLPNDWSQGSPGYATLPCLFIVGRA